MLPGGIVNGQKIKVPMMGHAADVFTSIPGDLLLNIEVKPHEFMTVEGKNIKSNVDINIAEAVLGCKITIQTAYGPYNINTEPGVCTGNTFILKHMGLPEFNPPEE